MSTEPAGESPAAPATAAAPATPGPDAVVAAAATKAGLVWVSADGRPAQSLWHVWHDGAVTVVVGGGEQPDPVAGADVVRLAVPSKDTRARLVEVDADVVPVLPGSDLWTPATAVLSASRLNEVHPAGQLDAWARSSRVLRLVPRSGALIGAGTDPSAGTVVVDVEGVRPRGWRPLRSRWRRRPR